MNRFTLLLIGIALLAGCGDKGGTEDTKPQLTATPSAINASAVTDLQYTIKVNSTPAAWGATIVEGTPEVVSIDLDTENNTITVSVWPNLTLTARSAKIRVTNPNMTVDIPITQAAMSSELAVIPDPVFAEYCMKICDRNNDGKLYVDEIKTTNPYYIDIQRNDAETPIIKSLKGIEYFTGAKVIKCSFNNLTSLDLSKNIVLEELYCSLNQLESLNLNGITTLKRVDCVENKLTSLDVSNNSQLEVVDCMFNELISLNITNTPNLTNLGCAENNLTTLDLSTSPQLTSVTCSKNQLSVLNINNCKELKYMDCQYNTISELNTAASPKLEKLFCIFNSLSTLDFSNHTSLQVLYCAENNLTELKLGSNTDLYQLYCSNNKLASLNLINLPGLIVLSCHSNPLTSLDISQNTLLTDLRCENSMITEVFVWNEFNISNYPNFSYSEGVKFTVK